MAERRRADASVKNSGNTKRHYDKDVNAQDNRNVPKSLNVNKLLKKTTRNMTKAEARTHEVPLRTEKTTELEKQADQDES